MIRIVVRRIAQSIPLLFVVSLLVFSLIHLAPGGPTSTYLDNPNVRPEDIARLKTAMQLDSPLTTQYFAWLGAFVKGDWGFSYADGRPVFERLVERLPATIELVSIACLGALLVAMPLGIAASVSRKADRFTGVVAIAGISLPVFWFGLVLQLVFAGMLGWLPSSGQVSFDDGGIADRLAHVIMPAVVLAASLAAGWALYLRRAMRGVLGLPFIHVARARGLTERALLLRHALPNALPTFVTVVLLDASMLASGAVVTESIFAWPGIGSLFTESLVKRDYTVLMAFLMCGSVIVMVLNLVADIAVRVIDPRTRMKA